MKNIIVLLFFVSKVAFAEVVGPTEIFGEAESADGKKVSALMLEPQETEPKETVETFNEEPVQKEKPLPDIRNAQNIKKIKQWSPQNPKPFSISPKAEQNEIENTLYEGGNRIYDVQSYPIKDIKTITEPNIDPTISTYPEY